MVPDHSGSLILICQAPATTRLPGATAARVSNLPASDDLEDKMARWQHRLLAARSPLSFRAAGSGDGWNQLAAGFDACPTVDKNWWVASAAAGLLHSGEPCPHALASFDLESPDCPVNNETQLQRWWETLGRERREAGFPGGITGLAQRQPESTFLIALNSDSLSALHPDLWEARESVTDPDRFLVLAGGPPACLGLGNSLLRIDARFEKLLGGLRTTLAARMARHLLEEFTHAELRAGFLQTWLKQMSWRLPKPQVKKRAVVRKKLGTLELENFVRRELIDNPRAKPTTLLRRLHESGRSCDPQTLSHFHQRYALPLLPG